MRKTIDRFGLATAIITFVGTILGIITQLGAFGDFRIPALPGRDISRDSQACSPATVAPKLSLSTGSGPSGTHLAITGHGFCPNQNVQISFHTEQIANAQTDHDGAFSVPATVPGSYDAFAPQQFTITTTGPAGQAVVPFRLTAR